LNELHSDNERISLRDYEAVDDDEPHDEDLVDPFNRTQNHTKKDYKKLDDLEFMDIISMSGGHKKKAKLFQ
jgi:hypothetical protein